VNRINGHQFAAKRVVSEDPEERRFVWEEYELVKRMDHPNVVSAEAIYELKHEMWFCMELCHDGNLKSYVKHHGAFDERNTRSLTEQLFKGVDYLHGMRVVHRDVKPENLLLQEDGARLRIGDFNSARQLGRQGTESTVMLTDRGTQLFAAPEIRFCRDWNERVDLWACGMSVFFMRLGRLPLTVERGPTEALRRGKLPAISWGCTGKLLRNLVKQCLTVDMHDRPSAMELLAHPLFTRVQSEQDFDVLMAEEETQHVSFGESAYCSFGGRMTCSPTARTLTRPPGGTALMGMEVMGAKIQHPPMARARSLSMTRGSECPRRFFKSTWAGHGGCWRKHALMHLAEHRYAREEGTMKALLASHFEL